MCDHVSTNGVPIPAGFVVETRSSHGAAYHSELAANNLLQVGSMQDRRIGNFHLFCL